MALGDQIQAVQGDALQAIDLEVAGDLEGATTAYLKASSQLQYILDVCVPRSQSDLVAVCCGLLQTFSVRLQVCVCFAALLLALLLRRIYWQPPCSLSEPQAPPAHILCCTGAPGSAHSTAQAR